MKNQKKLLTLLLVAISFMSCKKDGDETQAPKTKKELISLSNWKFSKATAAGFGDISSYVNACYKDNLYSFFSDLFGNVNEGALNCTPSNAGPFTWAFLSNETILQVSANLLPTDSSNFTIVSLTETTLVLSQLVALPAPYSTSVMVEFTLIH